MYGTDGRIFKRAELHFRMASSSSLLSAFFGNVFNIPFTVAR